MQLAEATDGEQECSFEVVVLLVEIVNFPEVYLFFGEGEAILGFEEVWGE